MVMMTTNTMRLAALFVLLSATHAFPVTSSRSSKKNRARPKTTGGAGFGSKAKVATLHNPDTSPEIANLMSFLTQQGSLGLDGNGGLEVGTCKTTGRRGVFCTAAYNKGEILCQIPSDLALALSDPNVLTSSTEEVTLVKVGANFLEMYMKNPEAQQAWKPYLDTLPTSSIGAETPDFYNEEELELLEFPRIINLAKDRKQELKDLIATKGNAMTVEELQWATWLVSSRSIQLSLSDTAEPETDDDGRPILKKNSKTLGLLLPFIDLANHSSNQPNACLHLIDPDKDDAWFALKATRNIAAGKELLHSYGSGIDSSVELLGNYGFVPDENKVDSFMLNRGGDDTEVQWTTTLEEDELMLKEVPADSRLQTILQFRARLKQAQQEVAAKKE